MKCSCLITLILECILCIEAELESTIPRIYSVFVESQTLSRDDILIIPSWIKLNVYLFGVRLGSMEKITFSMRSKNWGSDCDDDRFGETFNISVINSEYATFKMKFKDEIKEKIMYVCSRHKLENGSRQWTHQPLIVPKAFTSEKDLFKLSGGFAWFLYCLMLSQSALFSGLNLGIMTLDVLTLKILIKAGSASEKRMAATVLPIRERGNLTLCSLTMANVIVNVIISMLADRLIGAAAWAITYASVGILLFGEIIPQALCNKYSLIIAAHTIWFTKFVLYLTLPVAYPISVILDIILGEDMGRTLNRAKLAELIKQHGRLGCVDSDEVNIITGALAMERRTVKDAMTQIDDVYMLSINALLDFETTNDIIAHGFTRIPIFENDRRMIKSVLNVKDLAFVDPNDKIPISTICNFYKRTFIKVPQTTHLTDMFHEFREGNTHLAIVYEYAQGAEPPGETNRILGILTMEDVIEEIIQEEIVDETDIFTDNKRTKKRSIRCPNMDLWPILNARTGSHISSQLKIAVLRHLIGNTVPFSAMYVHTLILQGFLNCSFAKELFTGEGGPEAPSYYEAKKPASKTIFTLQGSMIVEFHQGTLQFEAGAFMLLGEEILRNINLTFPRMPKIWNLDELLEQLGQKAFFIPDFTSRPQSPVQCLEISAEQYMAMRFLSEQLEGISITEPKHGQVVQLYEQFWEVRKNANIQVFNDSAGFKVISGNESPVDPASDAEHSMPISYS